MLVVKNLSFFYPEKELLSQLNFVLNPGQLLYLRGRNGSGKTTLLKLLAGMLYPDSGEIIFGQQNIQSNLREYQRNVCFVGHKNAIRPILTVRESCLLDFHWGSKDINLPKLIKQYELAECLDLPCSSLSMGQRRRVALLRIAVTTAKLWLLDEPVTALDDKAIANFIIILQEHLNDGGLAVLTSHQPQLLQNMSHLEFNLCQIP